jgi:hypothetical protein
MITKGLLIMFKPLLYFTYLKGFYCIGVDKFNKCGYVMFLLYTLLPAGKSAYCCTSGMIMWNDAP